MATVAQATEQLIVQSATAVVTSVATSSASDFKAIELNVAKEVVSATDEDIPSLLEKVEDGIQDVAEEVVKGAEAAVEAVEQHPELIAEGVLAVAIGAASLIQPELVAGEVALIGKMAADSAKKTVTTIAKDTSTKVVKAISKDLADDAQEEAAKDAAAAAAATAKAGDGKEGEAATKVAVDPKDASIAPAPTASDAKTSPSTDATLKDPKDAPPKASEDLPKETVPAAPDAKHSPASIAASDVIKPVAPEPPKEKAISSADTKTEPEKPAATKDRTIAIEVTQEPSKDASSGEPSSADSNPEQAPVSLKITLGADGEVKAVTKGGADEQTKPVAPTPAVETVKTVSVEQTTKTAVVAAATTKLDAMQEAPAPVPQAAVTSDKKPEEVQEISKPTVNETKAVENTSKTDEAPKAVDFAPTVIDTPQAADTPKVTDTLTVIETPTVIDTPKAVDTPAFIETPKVNDAAKALSENTKTSDIAPKSTDSTVEAIQSPPTLVSPAVVSAVSNISTVTSTTNTKTVSQTTPSDDMVTISQESLDLLHQKIDTMHSAIQQIAAVLAYHLPTPAPGGTFSKSIKSTNEEINEALASAVKPLSELLPEILSSKNDDVTQPPLEISPSRPFAEKRTSVLAVIGKVFWPFGGDKVATVTVTEVDTAHSERAEVVA